MLAAHENGIATLRWNVSLVAFSFRGQVKNIRAQGIVKQRAQFSSNTIYSDRVRSQSCISIERNWSHRSPWKLVHCLTLCSVPSIGMSNNSCMPAWYYANAVPPTSCCFDRRQTWPPLAEAVWEFLKGCFNRTVGEMSETFRAILKPTARTGVRNDSATNRALAFN